MFFSEKLIKSVICSVFLALALTGCADMEGTKNADTPSTIASVGNTTGGSYGHSEYGHRPGPQGFKTVIIDAGHGGKDSGAISSITGQKEKDAALDTAKRLAANLQSDFKVVLIRSNDTFVELNDRVAKANKYDNAILISIHYNSGPSDLHGAESYYWRVDSHGLAVRCQQAVSKLSKGSTNCRGMVRRRLRLTRNPEIPCVLVEGGYLSNPAESRQIGTSTYRQNLANAIAGAIRAQAAVGDSGTGPLPKPINAPISRPTDAPE